MNLIIEDGQGIPDANAYVSLSSALAYIPAHLIAEWTALSDDERIDRLIIASQFIDTTFNWIGNRKSLEQGLNWPRINVIYQGFAVPCDTIPKQIKRAVIMALLIILRDGIAVFMSTADAPVKREKFAVMETEYFSLVEAGKHVTVYDDINNLLKGLYIMPSSGVMTAEVLRR